MQNPKSFVERIYYDGTREYTKRQGEIVYLDGSRLARPADMPRTQRLIALVIIIVAIGVGLFMVDHFVFSKWRESADAEKTVAANLAREGSLETIPQVASFINLDNDAIKATLDTAGYTMYDASNSNNATDLLLYRIPSDIQASEAASLFMKGVNSLDAVEASKLLNGSWSFEADRVGGTSMVVRYADFGTSDPQVAVQKAFENQGFDSASVSDSGIDESGNTFMMGTVDAGGKPCSWKISGLPLDEIYSISGLPTDACYVGIRVTAQ